ncbi:MAG: hypothetical protein JST81_02885 [Bacteroidetes bacterium]|nr:hypothetical protein [Bacteroidota bacterium]
MLHKRYDWKRQLFWVSLCLTLFICTQKSSVKSSGNNPADLVKAETSFLNRKWVK